MILKIFLLAAILFNLPLLYGSSPRCFTCKKRAKKHPFTIADRQYCSIKCLPADKKCSNCGNILLGRYMRMTNLMGVLKYFCARCSDAEKCTNCLAPVPLTHRGSELCPECDANRITPRKAAALMRKIRKDLKKSFGFDATHRITLKLVDRQTMTQIKGSSTFGYMKFDCKTIKRRVRSRKKSKSSYKTQVKTTCTIYMLDSVTEKRAGDILAHELTHDYLFHHLGSSPNSMIVEGICEAVAGAWLLKNGDTELFNQKKNNPLPEYGGGFRLIYPQLKRYGFKRMLELNRSSFTPLIR